MNGAMIKAYIGSLFFTDKHPEDTLLPNWMKYAIPVLLFVIIRFTTHQVNEYRGVFYGDDYFYVAEAEYINEHGHLATEDDQRYRQFAGLCLIMIPVYKIVGNMWLAGLIVVYSSAIASIVLIQYLFSNFRITILSTFFFPWWITETVTIYGEALVTLCILVGLWSLLRMKPWSMIKVLGLLICGFAIVVRPTTLFFILPFISIMAWRFEKTYQDRLVVICLVVAPICLFLVWSWATIHQLLPQQKMQEELRLSWLKQTVQAYRYPQGSMGWPFQALTSGLMDPYQKPGKKAMAFLAAVFSFWALYMLLRDANSLSASKERFLAQAFLSGYLPFFLFHASLGGTFGFWGFERYMSQMLVPMLWGLFHRSYLRWPWIIGLMLLFITYSFFTGPTGKHYIGFMK